MQEQEIVNLIKLRIEEGLKATDDRVTSWVRSHLNKPCAIEVIINYELGTKKTYWLVTDHTGKDDAGKRIAYDAGLDRFALIATSMTGQEILLGSYKNFVEAVYNL